MIISISGRPGSGKSTVGKLLAKKLGYRFYSIGSMRRAMAKERGLTLQEFNVLGEKHKFTDRDIDQWQADLGRQRDNFVVEGRTSFYFIPHSVKIFLDVNLREAARRIFHDSAHVRRFEASHRYETVKQLEHGLRHRIASDSRRYKKYYRLNIFRKSHYDYWLDTTKQTPAQTLKKILIFLANSVKGSHGTGHRLALARDTKPSASNRAKIRQKNNQVEKKRKVKVISTIKVKKLSIKTKSKKG